MINTGNFEKTNAMSLVPFFLEIVSLKLFHLLHHCQITFLYLLTSRLAFSSLASNVFLWLISTSTKQHEKINIPRIGSRQHRHLIIISIFLHQPDHIFFFFWLITTKTKMNSYSESKIMTNEPCIHSALLHDCLVLALPSQRERVKNQ